MLSPKLTRIISSAASYAARIGSPNTGLTHMLLAMVDESEIQRDLRCRGIDYAEVRKCLLAYQDTRVPSPPPNGTMTLSPLVVLVMERAISKDVAVEAQGLLTEMWNVEYDGQDDYYATSLLRELGQTAQDGPPEVAPPAAEAPVPAAAARPIPNLLRYCRDLVLEAERGAIDPVIGRDAHIGRVCEILARRKKNNPILIGEPGVGKTAIVEGLALRIAEGRTGPALEGARILSLDVAKLIDGTRNRGDFEGRLNGMVTELSENPDIILFVDEIHTLVGGASGAVDAANLLKPALASGSIRCIGATTHGEHARYFDADPAMSRRFQPVAVQPPTRDETVSMLSKLLPTYAGHHRVTYQKGAVEAAVDLSIRYVIDRHLPDKAIDVIDEAGAIASGRGLGEVTKGIVHETVSRMSGVETDPDGGGVAFGERLSAAVRGQDAACLAIASTVARSLSGLGREDRARCSMLFAGPEGSGKRFAAAAVARVLGQPLVRLDMSEFREAHSVTRLIGPPPGYIGFGSGGQLTEPVRRSPTCVLFLDRIHLAHPNVSAMVAQAVENGTLTDTSGRTASFAGATVIMTAAVDGPPSGMGFLAVQAADGDLGGSAPRDLVEAVDAVVRFVPFDGAALEEVAAAKMERLSERMRSQGIKLVSGAAVTAAIAAAAAAAAAAGAGGMAVERAFRRMVEDRVLDVRASDGQEVALTCENGEVVVRVVLERAEAKA